MIIVSRIIHVKVDRRLNVTNKFKYQRRLSSRLTIVMFRGTPCIKTVKLIGDTNNIKLHIFIAIKKDKYKKLWDS